MLAIISTHPIQYQVPVWKALAQDGRMPFEVWYLTAHGVSASLDQDFGKTFKWDIDLLSGYPHRFLDIVPCATPNSFLNCRLRESLEDRLRASGTKILWVQGWQVVAYWQAVRAAKMVGVEVWLRGESNSLAPLPVWRRLAKRIILGRLFKRVDKFLYIGTANRRLYLQYGVPEEKLHSSPYAVDNERFRKQAELIQGQRMTIRMKWKVPESAFCVLFCGKFVHKKRPMDLIDAVRWISASDSLEDPSGEGRSVIPSSFSPIAGLHLLFVGSGELGSRLRASCEVVFDSEAQGRSQTTRALHRSVRPRATFAGFLNQTEISEAYVAADCLVLPSDYGETWGLVVNEAMASDLVCIMSNRCGSSLDLGCAPNLVFNCGDIAELAACLVRVMKNPRRRGLQRDYMQLPTISETVGTVRSLLSARAK